MNPSKDSHVLVPGPFPMKEILRARIALGERVTQYREYAERAEIGGRYEDAEKARGVVVADSRAFVDLGLWLNQISK